MTEQTWIKTDCLTPYPYTWSGQAYLGDRPVGPKVYSHSRKSVRAAAYKALRKEDA